MKNFKKVISNALYIVLPLVFLAVIHLLFAYGNWEINPKNWTDPARAMASFCGIISTAFGVYVAYSINND